MKINQDKTHVYRLVNYFDQYLRPDKFMMASPRNSLKPPPANSIGKLWRSWGAHILLCLSGSILLAAGMTMFLQPNQIAGGGTPGMAILVCHLSGLTGGTAMMLINIPLLILGGYCLGQGFVWRTVSAVVAISLLVDLMREVLQVTAITQNPLLAAIIGGAGIGLGVGMILKGGASAGGPTIIARIVAERSPIRPGQLILLMDILIVCLSALVFGAIEPALLSMLSVFVTGRCIDLVLNAQAMKGPKDRGLHRQTVGSPYQGSF